MLSKSEDLIEHMQHENYIERLILRNRIMYLISSSRIWKNIAFLSAILLNAMILGYYSTYESLTNLNLTSINNPVDGVEIWFEAIEIIHIISSSMIFIFYYIKFAPVLYKESYRKINYYKYIKIILSIVKIHLNINTIYVCLYLVFSFLGGFLHVFFFAFHLLDFLYRYPTLQNVIYSVVVPYKSLIMLYCLILISIYLSSIIAYIYYSDYFLGNCDGLLLCAISCFAEGMKNSGGVGYYMYWNNPYVGQLHIGQFFFENLYNIIILIVMFNILAGIIIDTFDVLRCRNEDQLEDQRNKCFICGTDKDLTEEKTGKPFRYHRKYEHNEWYYIFFILYLRKKPLDQHSGIESLVFEEVSKGRIDWIPQGRGHNFET